jgi:hypothetical protein
MRDFGELSFGINFEPTNEVHALLERARGEQRREFQIVEFGSTYRVEFSAVPSIVEGEVTTDNGAEATATLRVEDIRLIDCTPANFHDGAD